MFLGGGEMCARPVVFALLLTAWCVAAAAAHAQFAPGPLSKAHRELDGTLRCTKCHAVKRGKSMDGECLACHDGIRALDEAGRGLHGEKKRKECAACHKEHAGVDFELIDTAFLDPSSFDHSMTGWNLRGKHVDASCEKCHKGEFLTDAVRRRLRSKGGTRAWIGLEGKCAVCHDDPHLGKLGIDCGSCHFETGFHDVVRDGFDHSKTSWALRGAHGRVDCAACHDSTSAWGARPPHDRCGVCHVDPHRGAATIAGAVVDCNACHDEETFRPSTYTVERHRNAPFPLEGKHAAVSCDRCHTLTSRGSITVDLADAGVLLRREHELCSDCHADAHNGQLSSRRDGGECGSCHTVDGWKSTTVTVESHSDFSFPLVGAHADAKCSACHGPDRPGLPPLPGTDRLGRARVALVIEKKNCSDCHVDPHDGRYSAGATGAGAGRVGGSAGGAKKCGECHGSDRFRPAMIGVNDHDTYVFPLKGAHRAVPCFECHRELIRSSRSGTLLLAGWTGKAIDFRGEFGKCDDCHGDAHAGQFTLSCDGCHGQDRFRPAVNFDHDRDSTFPLKGGHGKVKCEKCHSPFKTPDGETIIRYKPLSRKCESCHGDREIDRLVAGDEMVRRD